MHTQWSNLAYGFSPITGDYSRKKAVLIPCSWARFPWGEALQLRQCWNLSTIKNCSTTRKFPPSPSNKTSKVPMHITTIKLPHGAAFMAPNQRMKRHELSFRPHFACWQLLLATVVALGNQFLHQGDFAPRWPLCTFSRSNVTRDGSKSHIIGSFAYWIIELQSVHLGSLWTFWSSHKKANKSVRNSITRHTIYNDVGMRNYRGV